MILPNESMDSINDDSNQGLGLDPLCEVIDCYHHELELSCCSREGPDDVYPLFVKWPKVGEIMELLWQGMMCICEPLTLVAMFRVG